MVKFNEAVFITENLVCAGSVQCQSISAAQPSPDAVQPESCTDWTVQGNLVVQGKSSMFVTDTAYLTAGSVTLGNVRPVADLAVDLGDSTTAFNTVHAAQIMQTSDADKKDDIAACPAGLDFVNELKPVVFSRRGRDGLQYGFLAQDVNALDQTLATPHAVDYIGFVAVLVNAVQELSAKVDELSSKKRSTKKAA